MCIIIGGSDGDVVVSCGGTGAVSARPATKFVVQTNTQSYVIGGLQYILKTTYANYGQRTRGGSSTSRALSGIVPRPETIA